MVVSTGPSWPSIATGITGGFHSCDGVRSSCSDRPRGLRLSTPSIARAPLTDAMIRLVRTSVKVATCPHTAAPMPPPPMSAIW
jgi:hypothetical protein